MERMQREMNRLFTDYSPTRYRSAPSYPAMNLWADEESVIIRAELPGLKPDDLDISIDEGDLTLSGRRHPEEMPEDATYHRQERNYGSFTRSIRLPFKIEADDVEATMKNGVLTLMLPRAEEDKPKKIAIKTQ
jgi:HSP20 family protein